jgi:hypothetical protein
LHWSIIMKFKSWFCSDSKLIYVKEIIEKMNTLIYTFHFRLHNYMAHLSNVLELSRSFEIQWNLLFWKYIINQFYFGTNTKSLNLRIHELVIFNQTTKKSTFTVCYSRACFTSEKCNVPNGIRYQDLSLCKSPLY